jgi:AcrR family transcriptional regulator
MPKADRTSFRDESTAMPLSAERIVAAALAMARASGEPPGMRELAAALSVTPGALYRHVTGQVELVELMIDEVMEQVVMPDESQPDPWQRIRDYMRSLTSILDSHPGLDRLIAGYGDSSAAAKARQRWFLRQLRSGGLGSAESRSAYGAIHMYWLGSRQPPRRFADSFEFGLERLIDGLRTRAD